MKYIFISRTTKKVVKERHLYSGWDSKSMKKYAIYKIIFLLFLSTPKHLLLFLDLVSCISHFDCRLLPYYLVCQLWSTLEIPKSVAHILRRNKVVEVGYQTITFIWLDYQLIITHGNIFFSLLIFFHSIIFKCFFWITYWGYAIFSFIRKYVLLIWIESKWLFDFSMYFLKY